MNESFDNGGFEDMFDEPVPQKKVGILQRLKEKVFIAIRGMRKGNVKVTKKAEPLQQEPVPIPVVRKFTFPSFAFKIPANLSKILQKGLALGIFAVGVLILYSQLPTHPTLILGLILVSLSGNLITSDG